MARRGEQTQRVGVGGAGNDVVHRHGLVEITAWRERVVVEREGADEWVVVGLCASAALVDLVARSEAAELVTPGRELADQLPQHGVLGVASGVQAQRCRGGGGDLLPVDVEPTGVRIEEDGRAR